MKDFPSSFLRLCALLAVAQFGSCEYFSLKDVKAPGSHALATVSRFFIWSGEPRGTSGEEEEKDHGFRPSYGWGLWDSRTPLKAKIIGKDIAYVVPEVEEAGRNYDSQLRPHIDQFNRSSTIGPESIDMAIMGYDEFWEHFVPYQRDHRFCCTDADISMGICQEPGHLIIPRSVQANTFRMYVPVGSPQAAIADVEFEVTSTGIYFLMMINCQKRLPLGSFDGYLIARSAYGNLSGIDVPKLELYALGSLACAALAIFWTITSFRYRHQMMLLHHLIGGVISLALAEQIMWYIYLSLANVVVQPSRIVLGFAILCSMARNISASLLVLLSCLGLSITRPSLDPITKAKIVLGVAALAVLELTRQVFTYYHVSLDFSLTLLLFCAIPITFLYTVGFVWSFKSLNALLEELQARRQTAKHRQMCRYRALLVMAAFCFAVTSVLETYVLSMDIRSVWMYEWIFTNLVPEALFLFVLTLTSLIWRPNRSSKYYSYHWQLGDVESDDGMNVIDQMHTGKGLVELPPWDQTTNTTASHYPPDIRPWGEIQLDIDEENPCGAEAATTR